MFSVRWTCRCPGCKQIFQRESARCSLLARKAPNIVMLQSSASQNWAHLWTNLQLISQYPVSGMTVTVLASRIRSHPGFLQLTSWDSFLTRNFQQRCFLLDFKIYCQIQFNFSFISPVYTANKPLNLIILLLLVLLFLIWGQGILSYFLILII